MIENAQRLAERRVLILAPTGRDAILTRDVLGEGGVRSAVCQDLSELVIQLEAGAGALLISEEALVNEVHVHYLCDRLSRQEPWSDLPILLLTHPGADSPIVRTAVRQLGNVTLIERPVRVASMMTAARSALRARERQFHAREHLQELNHVAKALKDSEGRLKAVFANAAVGITEVTPDGRFAMINDALCRLLGESREALVGLPLARVAHAEDRAEVERLVERLLAREIEVFSGERRFVRRDGETIWVTLSMSLARANGEARGVAVIEDVTERKHAEEDLRESDRRKDEFLAVLAHELRNPLAPIRNSLHILRMNGSEDGSTNRVIDMMERQVQHMVRLVDDLLEVSRISRGKIELRKERLALATVLAGAIDTSRPLLDAANHTLVVELPGDDVCIDADAVRLQQVFANLLNNAAKYTAPGGEIRLVARVGEDGIATICVKDNGEGIPPQMLARVFNMFTQVNTGRRAQGGLGIGLTLARTLVHLHGGTIEAASEGQGQGCEFTVKLPVILGGSAVVEPQGAPRHAGKTLADSRVLVVDDNHDAADSLGMLLRFLGADVMVVHDGPGALAAMKNFQPAVVLLDLGMPEMDGLEVARRMRADPEMRNATLVALTGWGQREDRRRTGEAGFDYHLVKPADMGTLEAILTNAPVGSSATRH
jgi:PAS domain S-box-containing protein